MTNASSQRSIRPPLRVAVAQPLTRLGDLAGNVAAHVAAVLGASSRLVVFPELSLTGYAYDAPVVDPRSPALVPLVKACAEADCVALVGAPLRLRLGASGARGIGVLAIDADGVRPAYMKMNLGPKEATRFVAGERAARIEVDGWRVGIGVCKDTGQTDHLARTAALGIDLYVAGHVHAPQESRMVADRAARIRDRYAVPVAFAQYAGAAGSGYPVTSGNSAIWGLDGQVLARCTSHPGDVAEAVLT